MRIIHRKRRQATYPPRAETGNTDSFALEITISEDKYFVNNHEIGIEELKSEIDGLEAGATIKINDEKSSLKAFNAVKDYLDEKKIAYSVSNR